MTKIAIIINTSSLDYDGRVIAQIDALAYAYKSAKIKVLLLANKKTTISFRSNVEIDEFNLTTRNLGKSFFAMSLKMLEYALFVFLELLRFKPHIIHLHNETPALGVLFFRRFSKKSKIIYDDHELFNIPPKGIRESIMLAIERSIIRKSEIVITANYSRKRFVEYLFKPSDVRVIENWVYSRSNNDLQENTENMLKRINQLRERHKIIIHQGRLSKGRCVDLLSNVAAKLKSDWIILLIGATEDEYSNNLKSYDNVVNLGFVDYSDINSIWDECDAAICFYEHSRLNNRFCAPNRYYLAADLGLPVLVNKKNPELTRLVEVYNNGLALDTTNVSEDLDVFFTNFSVYKERAKKSQALFRHDVHTHPVIDIYKDYN